MNAEIPTYPRVIATNIRNLREVAPRLYVGAAYTLGWRDIQWDTIIDMCGTSKQVEHREDYAGYRRVVAFPLDDGDPIPTASFVGAVAAVKASKGPVLIHCAMGISRSVSMAYAMLRFVGLEHSAAMVRVLSPCGSRPMPNTFGSALAWANKGFPGVVR